MSHQPATSTGLLTATTQVSTRPGIFTGLQVNAGSGTTTIIIYDSNIAASDVTKILDKHVVSANTNTDRDWYGAHGIVYNRGLYVTLDGSGAECLLYYIMG